jgi:DNA-binding transcriptional MerR regulator
VSDEFILATEAGHLLGGRTAGTVRYYEQVGKLDAVRTSHGTRLFRKRDVLRLAAELRQRGREANGRAR